MGPEVVPAVSQDVELANVVEVEGDDTVQQVGVVTFNALQKEIAMKEQKLGEQGEGGGSNGGYMSPNYTAPSMSGDLEDEEDGDDDSSGTMGV